MGSSATTYGPCSITICKRAEQVTLKSEQLRVWTSIDTASMWPGRLRPSTLVGSVILEYFRYIRTNVC